MLPETMTVDTLLLKGKQITPAPSQVQATIKEEPLEEENEEEESRDDFAPQQRSRWQLNLKFLYFCGFVSFSYFCSSMPRIKLL